MADTFGDPKQLFGKPTPRIDGKAKVTGSARFASDEPVGNPAYAYLVTSRIAKGRVTAIKLDAAKAVPGVLDILTHGNVGGQAKPAKAADGGPNTPTLDSDQVMHDGQIVAVVIADTYEAAREAAGKVAVTYAAETPSATFGSKGVKVASHKSRSGKPFPKKGDAARAYRAAPVKVDARYSTPPQHHNAIELFTSTCEWDGDHLTVYEPTQAMWGSKAAIAAQLGLEPENVRVVGRYIGGAFGGKGANAYTAWVAIAAKRLNRPVKLVVTREQGFTVRSWRAETRQQVRISAGKDGRLTSFFHSGQEVTSRPSQYAVAGVEVTPRMYACPNIDTKVEVVHADRPTPGFMRAPAETPYFFGLESAMDELAWKLNMDPVELRRINDTRDDPVTGLPFSTRSLMQCYDAAAAKFGWSQRSAKPGSMTDADWLIGYGCATATYPANVAPAAARLTLTPDGKAVAAIAGHEMGTGAYTVVAITAAGALGIPVDKVKVLMGDSDLPPLTIGGGSNNAASKAHVVAKAAGEIRKRLAEAAVAANGPFKGLDPATLTLKDGKLLGPSGQTEDLKTAVSRVGSLVEVYAENNPEGLPPEAMANTYKGQTAMLRGGGRKDHSAFSFGAHFVEVRVHRLTREIRVPRVVSAFAGGTIINPLTAYSQYMGGVIWGLSAALFEATDLHQAQARYVNNDLAGYVIPVNADTPSIDVIMVDEPDNTTNPLGIKGIGEIGITGMNAAVANAVYHATGIRVRDLPIRPEKLLAHA